jgi:hypothetical protein
VRLQLQTPLQFRFRVSGYFPLRHVVTNEQEVPLGADADFKFRACDRAPVLCRHPRVFGQIEGNGQLSQECLRFLRDITVPVKNPERRHLILIRPHRMPRTIVAFPVKVLLNRIEYTSPYEGGGRHLRNWKREHFRLGHSQPQAPKGRERIDVA